MPVLEKMELSMCQYTIYNEHKSKEKEATRNFKNNKENLSYPADVQNTELKETTDGTKNDATLTSLDFLGKAAVSSMKDVK